MNRVFLLAAALALASATACTPTSRTRVAAAAGEPAGPSSLQDRYNTLSDAFRSLPNVQVVGNEAIYRGVSTLSGDSFLRVATEGRIVGLLSDAERLYPLDEIRGLVLVRPAEAQQRYGMLGSYGVVELVLREG